MSKETKDKIAIFKPDKTKNLRDFISTPFHPFIPLLIKIFYKGESSIDWVKQIIAYKNFTDQQITTIFSNDLEIQKARDHAFQIALRDFKETPQFLSLYCDDLMKQCKQLLF